MKAYQRVCALILALLVCAFAAGWPRAAAFGLGFGLPSGEESGETGGGETGGGSGETRQRAKPAALPAERGPRLNTSASSEIPTPWPLNWCFSTPRRRAGRRSWKSSCLRRSPRWWWDFDPSISVPSPGP
jgi:hypothetical protein